MFTFNLGEGLVVQSPAYLPSLLGIEGDGTLPLIQRVS
jgi:hypothetical protein